MKEKEEIPKKKPKVPIGLPVVVCPECYKPMELLGKVDVDKEERTLFKKRTRKVPHIEFRCPSCGMEWRESLERRGGGCFIATATFGTPMAHEVNILRKLRDELLLQNRTGEMFVRVYYTLSPPIARTIEKSEMLRRVVRIILTPIVKLFNLVYGKH